MILIPMTLDGTQTPWYQDTMVPALLSRSKQFAPVHALYGEIGLVMPRYGR